MKNHLITIDSLFDVILDLPALHVSFIKRQRSLTEEALRPRKEPIVAQSEPCLCLSLQ